MQRALVIFPSAPWKSVFVFTFLKHCPQAIWAWARDCMLLGSSKHRWRVMILALLCMHREQWTLAACCTKHPSEKTQRRIKKTNKHEIGLGGPLKTHDANRKRKVTQLPYINCLDKFHHSKGKEMESPTPTLQLSSREGLWSPCRLMC